MTSVSPGLPLGSVAPLQLLAYSITAPALTLGNADHQAPFALGSLTRDKQGWGGPFQMHWGGRAGLHRERRAETQLWLPGTGRVEAKWCPLSTAPHRISGPVSHSFPCAKKGVEAGAYHAPPPGPRLPNSDFWSSPCLGTARTGAVVFYLHRGASLGSPKSVCLPDKRAVWPLTE